MIQETNTPDDIGCAEQPRCQGRDPRKLAATDEPEEAAPLAVTATAWPKKLAEQFAATRDLLTKGAAKWTVAEVATAFKGAKKSDVEEGLDSLVALGILAAYEARGTRRWKSIRAAA